MAVDYFARGGTFSTSTREIREHLNDYDKSQLERCGNAIDFYRRKDNDRSMRRTTIKRCKNALCPFCGPYDFRASVAFWADKFRSLHPEGRNTRPEPKDPIDLIHWVLTPPDWMRELILRREPKPRSRKEIPPANGIGPVLRKKRRRNAREDTTPGIEALKAAAWQFLADVYCGGSKTRAQNEIGCIMSLHMFGDDGWEYEPHLDICLVGHRLKAGQLKPLPKWFKEEELARHEYMWAKCLRKEFLRIAKTLDEHAKVNSLERAVTYLGRGSGKYTTHRTRGRAFLTLKYSMRSMFCLKWAKLVQNDGGPLMLRYAPDIKNEGAKIVHEHPLKEVAAQVNTARGWLSGVVAHTPFGILKNGYKPAMKTLGRAGRSSSDDRTPKGEWIHDRTAYRVGSEYYDPGPTRDPTLIRRGREDTDGPAEA